MFINSFADRCFYDADDGAPSGGTPGGQNPADPKGGHPETVSKADYDKIVAANNWAQSEVKKLNNSIRELQSKVDSFSSDDGDGGKGKKKVDIDALLAKNAELETQLNTERKRSKDERKARVVREKVGAHLAPDTWDYYWGTQQQNFELVERDGQEKVEYAPAPYMSWEQIVESIPPSMRASKAKAGAGNPSADKGANAGGSVSAAQLQAMDEKQRRAYLAEHPELWPTVIDSKGL